MDDPLSPARLAACLAPLGYPPAERDRLVRLMVLLATRPHPPDPLGLMPRYGELHARFLDAARRDDAERLEEAFLELYCHLHGHEAPYTDGERRRVDETGGYWCHAGGLSPLLRAGPYLGPDSVSVDLGAGNGLQGLLLQVLNPHRSTVQIEISSRLVEAGRHLQRWLDIPEDRVEWRVQDVCQASVRGVTFLYLYRPVRPDGEGRVFYERLARELETSPREVVVFSIADCLRPFLSDAFELIDSDGQLTCLKGPVS